MKVKYLGGEKKRVALPGRSGLTVAVPGDLLEITPLEWKLRVSRWGDFEKVDDVPPPPPVVESAHEEDLV